MARGHPDCHWRAYHGAKARPRPKVSFLLPANAKLFRREEEASYGHESHRRFSKEPRKDQNSCDAARSATRDRESAGHFPQNGGGTGGGTGGTSAAVQVLPRRAAQFR